ncbi:protein FAM83F isoform X2 [Antennarius striatus]|uniref:protein FAM83F isoform X2 n=1 Tax=Antennarius striatus TaxID=241820 RepID=UPI0035B4AEA7
MAASQLRCMDDEHVNEKIPESRPEFYYSEEQRAALEQLVRHGDGAFKLRLKEDNVKDFLCAKEVKFIRKTFQEYHTDGGDAHGAHDKSQESSSADSGVHSTYWPQMSDTEVPCLDLGWPGGSGVYKGVTRVSVYTHPPKEPGPHIKEVVRRLIQEAQKNLRVRMVKGAGLALSFGRLPGSQCSKYMLVDGEKVVFGSYSFTWSSSRMDRNIITVMSGQVVDHFDVEFRELYAMSEHVDLYREFNITKPPLPAPIIKPKVEPIRPIPVSTSRFQVSVNDQVELKVPAHKYHNPKYSLVFGNTRGLTGSLQDLSRLNDLLASGPIHSNGFQNSFINDSRKHKDKLDQVSPKSPGSPSEEEDEDGKGGPKKNQTSPAKKRSSFRNFLKAKGTSRVIETIEEGVVTPQTPTPPCKVPETNGVVVNELEDSFEIIDSPGPLKPKPTKPSKVIQRSMSLQTINTGDEDGSRSRRRHQKKNCIQS